MSAITITVSNHGLQRGEIVRGDALCLQPSKLWVLLPRSAHSFEVYEVDSFLSWLGDVLSGRWS